MTSRVRSRILLLGVAVCGAALGLLGSVAVQEVPPPSESAPAEAVKPAKRAPLPQAEERLVLVWTPGGLPADLLAEVEELAGVQDATVVHGGMLELTATLGAEGSPVPVQPDGFVVPLDAIAIDPERYASLAPASDRKALAQLQPGEALLGATSATLRAAAPGSQLLLADGTAVTVAGVVADEAVAAAEVVVHRDGPPLLTVPRYLLVRYRGARSDLEQAVRALAPTVPVRLREAGETPFLRHGDAVLPQSLVKERFGEFAYRPGGEGELVQDPVWVAEHIVTVDVPILGRIRCHRAVVDAVHGALTELADRNLGMVIDPAGYQGCHHARLTNAGDAMSRHAWGVALDLNVPENPQGRTSAQDSRLVEVFERWGFTWGGSWLVPDAAHVEYLQPSGR